MSEALNMRVPKELKKKINQQLALIYKEQKLKLTLSDYVRQVLQVHIANQDQSKARRK